MREVDAEIEPYFRGLEDLVEAKMDAEYEMFEPLEYSTQVVAGMKYNVLVEVADDQEIEIQVFKGLNGVSEITSVSDVMMVGPPEDGSPIDYNQWNAMFLLI